MNSVTITDVRAFVLDQKGSGGDYHDREEGHYLVDTLIATPMSPYPSTSSPASASASTS